MTLGDARRGMVENTADRGLRKGGRAMENNHQPAEERSVGIGLGLGIFCIPVIFSWFTLRNGHTEFARIAAFAWLGVIVLATLGKPLNTSTATSAASVSSPLPEPAASEAPAKPSEVFFHDKNPRSPCRPMATNFSTSSDKTELQLDGMFGSMKGQLFQYDVRVKAVEMTFGSLSLQATCARKRNLLDTSDFVLSADDKFKPQLGQLSKGAAITVCGRFTSYTRITGLHGDLVALGPCPNSTLTGRVSGQLE
jgi:hypothetical protein